jgi:hypothetical protein
MNKFKLLFLLLTLITAYAQPSRKLVGQQQATTTANIDFSQALATSPLTSGASLPPTCTPPQMFYKTSATAGQNIYGCTSTDIWTLQGDGNTGGGGGGAAAGPTSTVSGSAIAFACGANCYVNTFNMNNATGSASGFGSQTSTMYTWAQGGVYKIGYPSIAPTTLTNVTGVSGITTMPIGPDIYQMSVCTIISGTLSSCNDVRNVGSGQPLNYAFNPSTFVTAQTGTLVNVTGINGGLQGFGVRVVFTGSGTFDYTVPFTNPSVSPIRFCDAYAGSSTFTPTYNKSTGVVTITASGAGTAECTIIAALNYAYSPGQDFLLAISPTFATADSSLQATTTATITAGNQSGWTSGTTFTCKTPCPGSIAVTPSSTLTGTGTRTITATLSSANTNTFTIAATAADGTERTATFPVTVTYAPIYTRVLTYNVAQTATALTNYPVLVDVTHNSLRSTGNSGYARTDGNDIVFSTDIGGVTSITNVEKETYDPVTGHWRGWVTMPLTSASATTPLYVFVGFAGATTSQYTGTPWGGNYSSVLHMDSTLGLMYDSARGASGSLTAGTATSIAGKVGTAFNFDGSTYWTLSNVSNWPSGPRQPFTISFWASIVNNAQNAVISAGNTVDYQVLMPILGDSSTPGLVVMEHHNNSVPFTGCTFSTSTATHFLISYDGTTETLYKNGTTCGSTATPSTSLNLQAGSVVMLGAPEFLTSAARTNGWVDELRVEKIAQTAGYAAAVYNNTNSPSTFVTFVTEGAAH